MEGLSLRWRFIINAAFIAIMAGLAGYADHINNTFLAPMAIVAIIAGAGHLVVDILNEMDRCR